MVLGSAEPAEAYCRTSVCPGDHPGTLCVPPASDDCGIPLHWAGRCIGFSVQQDGSAQISWDAADAIVAESFATWSAAPCAAGGGPTIEGVDLGPVECAAQEYNSSGGNVNLIVFRDEAWPYAGQWNTLALTTVTYNLDTGEIYDADMEINSADITLTTGDTNVQFDLRSIVTHETGHMLGLAHTSVAEATMGTEYVPGDLSLRDLEADDVQGICTAYPPGPPRSELGCDPTPRHGFKTTCGPGPADEGCCTVAPGGGADRRGGAIAALLGLLVLATRRHRRRRPSTP